MRISYGVMIRLGTSNLLKNLPFPSLLDAQLYHI